jgi:methionyl-tRNA formyltransferase
VRSGDELDASALGSEDPGRHRARGRRVRVSVMFGYMLREPIRRLFPRECINLHPAYLPWNRGAYPNVWSIVERTPAGATLHYVDDGVDTGDIIAQRRVVVAPHDTGETLYGRLEAASLELFRDTWPLFAAGRAGRTAQSGEGSFHRVHDVEAIDAIDPGRAYAAGELVDIPRARTFPPHAGVLTAGNRRIHVRVELEEPRRHEPGAPSAFVRGRRLRSGRPPRRTAGRGDRRRRPRVRPRVPETLGHADGVSNGPAALRRRRARGRGPKGTVSCRPSRSPSAGRSPRSRALAGDPRALEHVSGVSRIRARAAGSDPLADPIFSRRASGRAPRSC